MEKNLINREYLVNLDVTGVIKFAAIVDAKNYTIVLYCDKGDAMTDYIYIVVTCINGAVYKREHEYLSDAIRYAAFDTIKYTI